VPPRLDEGPPAVRGWLRVSDDAVREVGIETVLQEGAGAFMLYYERVVGEDGPGRSWSGAGIHAWEAGAGGSDANGGGGEGDGSKETEKAQLTHRVVEDPEKHALEQEQENVVVAIPPPPPLAVIKARVVRSVSLGPDEMLGGTSVSAKLEAEVPVEAVDPESVGVGEPTVELPLTASVKAPSPIPEPPVVDVDEPPISLPRTVDLRA